MLGIYDANEFRRAALGLCLAAGPLVALIGGLVTPWEETSSTAAYLQALGENPVRAQASAVLLYFGYLLMAVGVFGMMHLLRRRAVVLGHVGVKILRLSNEEWERGLAPAAGADAAPLQTPSRPQAR